MARPRHYSPALDRFLVTVMYHEARHRKVPMTQLANELLKNALAESVGWQVATQSLHCPEQHLVIACPGK